MKKLFRTVIFGIFSWLVPFVTAFFFYSKEGNLTIDIHFFKSIMVVAGCFVGSVLLVIYFSKFRRSLAMEGFVAGIVWLAINIILDYIILIPMMKVDFSTYFTQIGMRYFTILITAVTIGYVADKRR